MRGCGLDGGGRSFSMIGDAEEKEMSIEKGCRRSIEMQRRQESSFAYAKFRFEEIE